MCSLDILIAGKYRLGRKLGGGSFGEIFLGTNLQTGEEVGIKLVSRRGQTAHPAVCCCCVVPTTGALAQPNQHTHPTVLCLLPLDAMLMPAGECEGPSPAAAV